MKFRMLCLFSLIFFAAQTPIRAGEDESNWQKIFECEFDSPDDLKKWNLIERSQNANNELQYYDPKQISVKDGCLEILAEKKESNFENRQRHYCSGLLNTQHKLDMLYGRFDLRFKVPAGKGYWPAFWLLPSSDAWPPEIDWMEILGDKTRTILVTNHWGEHKNGNHPMYGIKYKAKGPDFAEDFHTLSGRWSKDEIVCYVDGKKVYRSGQGVPQEKMFMILNLAIGGDLPGNPDESTSFPGKFVVDYVRVYKPR